MVWQIQNAVLGNDTGSTGAGALAAKTGVKFNMSGYDDVDLRNFGGQKKKTDCFCTERYRESRS